MREIRFLSRTSLRQMGESKHMYETVKKLLVEELQIKEQDITPEAELSADLGIFINSSPLAMWWHIWRQTGIFDPATT